MKNFRKIAVLFTAALLASVMCLIGVSAEGIDDTAKVIQSGKKYTGSFSDPKFADFKITVGSAGTMKISLDISSTQNGNFYLYDSNGNSVAVKEEKVTTGSFNGDTFKLNDVTKKFSGKLSASVKKGTYYIRMTHIYASRPTYEYSLTVTVPGSDSSSDKSLSSSKNNSIRLYMDKGDKISLSAVTSGRNVSASSWKSSNEKVAKVSSNGKITAVGTGSCTVVWKNGSAYFTVYIEVE